MVIIKGRNKEKTEIEALKKLLIEKNVFTATEIKDKLKAEQLLKAKK